MIQRVRLFAMLRERAGSDSVEVDLRDGATVAEAIAELGAQHDALSPLVASMPLVMAVNQEYAEPDTVLAADDELALIPPVSGGSEAGAVHARVIAEPLSADRLERLVTTDQTGAVVTFRGTTRDVDQLDYEADLPMASERMAAILVEISARHEVEGVAAEHRIGTVPRREPSVIVVVAAAHRGPAFAAAREAIDRIKAEVPIWKQEVEGELRAWVEGTPPA